MLAFDLAGPGSGDEYRSRTDWWVQRNHCNRRYDAVVVRTAAVRQWVCTAEGAVGDGGSVASQRG